MNIVELQGKASGNIKQFLREELGKDIYEGKLQCVMVLTNTQGGFVMVDSCNVNLEQDAIKLLREGVDQFERSRIVNAIRFAIRKEIRDYENVIRSRVAKTNKEGRDGVAPGQGGNAT